MAKAPAGSAKSGSVGRGMMEERRRAMGSTLDRPDAAVQGEFADHSGALERLGEQLPGGHEQARAIGEAKLPALLGRSAGARFPRTSLVWGLRA
jgi:hypothetical protein